MKRTSPRKELRIHCIRFIAISFIIVSVGILSVSCGYEIVKEKGIYGGDILSISLPVFKNRTYEPHASKYLTDAFSRELVNIGILELNRATSEATLEGIIKRVRITPYTLSTKKDLVGIVEEKKLEVTIEVSLLRSNGVLIKRWTLSDNEVYRAEADYINYIELNKEVAFKKVSERLARRFSALLLVEY